MATQNLVSASLSAEVKADVLGKLASIRSSMAFLRSLEAGESQTFFKLGNGYAPFLEKAYAVAQSHPEIMAGTFDMAEFKRDYALAKDLTTIVDQMNELSATLHDTLMAVSSDAISAALEVYSAVKGNTERVPGLKVASGEMAEFFRRSKKKETATA